MTSTISTLNDWNRGLMVPMRGSVEGEMETAQVAMKRGAEEEMANRAAVEADLNKRFLFVFADRRGCNRGGEDTVRGSHKCQTRSF